MSLDKNGKVREKREWNRFFLGVALGTILGVIGNLWASFLIKAIETYYPELEPEAWLGLFSLFSVLLFVYGIGLALLGAKGYRFVFKSSGTKKSESKKVV
ncbi:MAG: hypothetical protein JSV12_03455 [Candidatus Bathyarchaeota archaeon]|nr:MAG: hypothetical protein JSV12_03455 [Candidatus Bathyarchaeota archaeon]